MGIRGLTTYLRENQALIAKHLQFPKANDELTTFVVDGWSFIYEVYTPANLPWVYGGEYGEFSDVVERTVRTWLSVGIRLYFVFDGPYPAIKFPTITSRMTQTVQGSLLFFRTSSTSRSTQRFLNEIDILPSRAYTACIQILQNIIHSLSQTPSSGALKLFFADEEGDPFAVELAARVGGYVVAKDSDYVILNAEGYKGYVPMDEMVWTFLAAEEEVQSNDGGDDGFQTVVNSKAKKKAAILQKAGVGRGLIPPEDTDDLQLSVSVYAPTAVASQLQVPVSLLPLLGSLVGNDFTGSKETSSAMTTKQTNLQWLFFERHLTLSQRITRVANTLRDILSAALTPSGKGKQKFQVNSVMDLIKRAISALMVRSPDILASGERESIEERVVEATLQYAISRYEGAVLGEEGLWASSLCSIHEEEACSLVRYLSQTPSSDFPPAEVDELIQQRDRVRDLYIAAYHSGKLSPITLNVMNTGTFWHRQMLENPDLETVARSIARPIQEMGYVLLDDGLGLPEKLNEDEEDFDNDQEEDGEEDELVDVVEESDDEDLLAPLRGALQKLDGPANGIIEPPPSLSSRTRTTRLKPKTVVEYLRRGTRIAEEEVAVPSISDLLSRIGTLQENSLPLQLRSEDDRMTCLLCGLGSDVPIVKALPPHQLVIALSLRWVVSRMDLRARESNNNKDRIKEKWTKHEARGYLASFQSPKASPDSVATEIPPPILDRNVQLVAQVCSASDAIERFAEILLLSDRLPSPVLRFSGRRFQSYLTGSTAIPADAVSTELWDACIDGLEDAYGEANGRKRKKERKEEVSSSKNDLVGGARQAGKINKGKAGGGMFGLLASMEA